MLKLPLHFSTFALLPLQLFCIIITSLAVTCSGPYFLTVCVMLSSPQPNKTADFCPNIDWIKPFADKSMTLWCLYPRLSQIHVVIVRNLCNLQHTAQLFILTTSCMRILIHLRTSVWTFTWVKDLQLGKDDHRSWVSDSSKALTCLAFHYQRLSSDVVR